MEKFDAEKLIVEVERRPALWDMTIADYSDRAIRQQCWKEITDVFAPEDMTEPEMRALGT